MVINTNMTGLAGAPLAKSNSRPESDSKNIGSSAKQTAADVALALDSQVNRLPGNVGSDIDSAAAAGRITQLAKAGILSNPATAMLAQANLSPETVLSLLQP